MCGTAYGTKLKVLLFSIGLFLSFSVYSQDLTSNPIPSNDDYLKETLRFFSQTLTQLKKSNENSESITQSLLFTLPNLMSGLQSMDQRLISWESSILKVDENLVLSGQILAEQQKNFPQLSEDSKQILTLSQRSKETLQKMESSTTKWSEDLENLRKDMGLILRSNNIEKWILRGGIAFLITERVYNLMTGKMLFFF